MKEQQPKNIEEIDEVLVRDTEFDVVYFLTEKEAKVQEALGKVEIVKEEKEDE